MNSTQCRYSEGITHQKIAIVGIEPPPLGGVSVHISRVMDRFLTQRNRVFLWPAENRMRRFFPLYICMLFWWLIRYRPDYLYYHATYMPNAVLELWFLRLFKRWLNYNLSIIDHDCRHLAKRSSFAIAQYKTIVAASDKIICIGQSVKKSYEDKGIINEHISIDDAFIPPLPLQALQIRAQYPSSLTIFIKDHTPILLVSAAHFMRIEEQDIYGVDTALGMIEDLVKTYPDIGLIIALPAIVDHAYFNELLEIMKTRSIAEHIFILHGNNQLWPLFKNVDIFIRPTRSDGDSISVREALYFNIPVVASDICPRPEGAYLFKTGDAQAGASQVNTLLKDLVYGHQQRDSLHAQSMD